MLLKHTSQVSGRARSSAAQPRSLAVSVHASQQAHAQQADASMSRRSLLGGVAAGLVASQVSAPLPAFAAKNETAVGTYLPPSGVEDFVLFVPDKQKTPSLRAGTVDPSAPYKFSIPPSWSEQRVNNTASGNYCQPRCDEPWTEVVFGNDAEGRLELIVSPLKKLTPKKNVKVEDLGTPEQLLGRIGNYITGTYLDEDEPVVSTSKQLDGITYYFYDINAIYGKVGPHTLTACTVKGDLAYLFIISATDKQWAKNEDRLRKLVQTFRP